MVGFFDGLAGGVGPCSIVSTSGNLLSAWVPDASLKPTLPIHVPAGSPAMESFHDPLVSRATVCVTLGIL